MPRSPRSTPKIMQHAVVLRKAMTPAERKLWAHLRNDQLGLNFRRQHAIGNYIVDFYCPRVGLVIELDGSQHLEQEEYDQQRTSYFKAQGCRMLRFWNSDVMKDINAVLVAILQAINEHEELRNASD